jgi:hypothetical protein
MNIGCVNRIDGHGLAALTADHDQPVATFDRHWCCPRNRLAAPRVEHGADPSLCVVPQYHVVTYLPKHFYT